MKTGRAGPGADTAILDELCFLLESGSDRIGALDFQRSPSEYAPRAADGVGMEELIESSRRVEEGVPLDPKLDMALLHGSSIGGARPKVLIGDRSGKRIAKFSTSADPHNVIKAEFVAMRLARIAGLNAAPVELVRAADRGVLLVERFDRERRNGGWTRRAMVSALTLLALDETAARYASYETLALIIRHRFSAPKDTLRDLFGRLVFNVLCGNTDDHARNHAAFWDGRELSLTPAYDICPQPRVGGEASQAMRIAGGSGLSRLSTCLDAAGHFLLSPEEARDIFARLRTVVEERFDGVCEEAGLGAAERSLLRERAFLKPWSIGL